MDQRFLKDRYGFFFWFRWIITFAGSFLIAAIAWTLTLQAFFGPIRGGELTFTWIVAVFGSWFILVTPFMRKKEQIWKRLNDDQEKAVDAWLGGISMFVGLLIACAIFWDFRFYARVTEDLAFDGGWAKAVIGSWLVLTLPFLAILYRQADRIFKNAVVRQTYSPNYKSHRVDASYRQIPPALAEKLKKAKPTIPGGHLATLFLRNGRRVDHVFILHAREVAGIYDHPELDFNMQDIQDIVVTPPQQWPTFHEAKWTRFNLES